MPNRGKVWNGSEWVDLAPTATLQSATTSAPGITQLVDSVSSTSTASAAVPNSVKTSYDFAATKAKVSVGTATPSSPSTGDVWIDTAGTATAINAVPLAALTGTGAMIYGASAGTAATLAIGSTDQQLVVSSGVPAWAANPSITKATLTTTGDVIYASGANTPARLGIGTAGQVLGISAGVPAWTTISAGGGILKYEEFTSSGSFVIPSNASSSAIVLVEIGDGGEGGRGGNKGVTVQSTGGAGGAMVTYSDFLSTLGTAGGTVTVTIGAGGAGGAGATGSGNRGVRGSVGGYSSIGNLATKAVFAANPTAENDGRYSPQVLISGVFHSEYTTGMADSGGTVAGGTVYQTRTHTNGGNAYRYNGSVSEIGVMGQDSDFNGAAGGGGADSSSPYVAYPGGHGGKRWGYRGGHFVGFDASNRALITVGNGAAGGTGASGGGGAGTAATAGSGGGGGGGGNASTGNGGAGGAGAAPSGGGGGGGGSLTGNGGAGGAGGAGRVRVWVIG